MENCKELKQACLGLQKSLDELQLGVVSSKEKISMEQDILNLRETAEFINSKLLILKIDGSERPEKIDTDITKKKDELIDSVIKSQITENVLHNTLMDCALKCIEQNTSTDSDFIIYKQIILEQLELCKKNSEQIIQLSETKNEVTKQLNEVQSIHYSTYMFNKKLKEKQTQYQKECNENQNDDYKQKMQRINGQIKKINFMRFLILRLLTYSEIKTKRDSDFKKFLRSADAPVSIDSLLKQ